MVANETNQRHQMSYQEVVAALPAYAQGALDPQTQAVVDSYLNHHVDLFCQLDQLEAGGPRTNTRVSNFSAQQLRSTQRQPQNSVAFAQVMEGYASTQQLPDNPLLMRNAPQRITDHRTGQRFIVPRRQRAPNTAAGKYPQGEQTQGWGTNLLWGLLALAAVAALTLVGIYQLRLQRQLAATKLALTTQQQPPPSTPPRQPLNLLGITPPTTAWLTIDSQNNAPLGTLFIDGQTGMLVIQNLPTLPTDQAYQLWVIDQHAVRNNVTTFVVTDPRQAQWVPFTLPLTAGSVVQIGLSIEPASGSTQPSGAFVLTSLLR